MRRELHAEWTKLRSLPSTGWLLLATVALTVALSATATLAARYTSQGPSQDLTKLSLFGVVLGQALVAILAVLAISDEYSTGMIGITLTAMPHRVRALAAKATVVGVLVLASGAVAVGGCLLAGRLILPTRGFTAAHGYALLSLANGPTLRAAAGSVLYLALTALLSLGIAAAVRASGVAVGLVLGVLFVFPIIAAMVNDPHWQRHLLRIGPMTAGLSIQATTNLRTLPIAPWTGLGVLAAWAAAALVVGVLRVCVCDA
jgi:ABC-2 type transport system permease protein